ncbi:hypothetical protein SAMN05421847_1468 [Halpernia humi]|uniref:Uncharacterized protein n=1 Tax=Halpernia humi TaxID=493375 RepID=A0A1H5X8E8_9FLAO|nr:hypothetical protein SAMN05421847_1468 [Halpernia humi]
MFNKYNLQNVFAKSAKNYPKRGYFVCLGFRFLFFVFFTVSCFCLGQQKENHSSLQNSIYIEGDALIYSSDQNFNKNIDEKSEGKLIVEHIKKKPTSDLSIKDKPSNQLAISKKANKKPIQVKEPATKNKFSPLTADSMLSIFGSNKTQICVVSFQHYYHTKVYFRTKTEYNHLEFLYLKNDFYCNSKIESFLYSCKNFSRPPPYFS